MKTGTNWEEGTTTMADLRRSAFEHRTMTSAFEWLKRMGLVPEDVTFMKVRQVLKDLDPHSINIGYLASSAYEWDTWGTASPVAFVKALACETKGAKRDLIYETLLALGRHSREEAVA